MISFVETKLFTKLVQEYLTDDEYQELQSFLIAQPEAGGVVPVSGGVRKLRWRARGRGKRAGYRVIYLSKVQQGVFWMLTIYPKSARDTISLEVLRKIRKEVEND